jgi:hypothetical protein
MPNDDDQQPPEEQNRIDRSLQALTGGGRPFSVDDVVANAGIADWSPFRPQALAYARRKLAAIGGANQTTVTDAAQLRPWEDFAPEERIDALLDVIFSDLDGLDEEAKNRALNAIQTWTFLRESFRRNELHALLLSEKRKFIREHEDGR